MHIKDVLDAFEKAIFMADKIMSGSVFVLSEGDHISNNELYRLIYNEIYGKRLNLIHLPKWFVRCYIYIISNIYTLSGRNYFFKPWMVNLTDKKYRFNTDKAGKILGWQPRYQIKRYMKVIISNLRDNPHRWFSINNIE